MTKNKLAKLAARSEENGNVIGELAQQPLPDDFDPVSMLDEHLERCANVQQFSVDLFSQVSAQQAPVLKATEEADYGAFDSGVDVESALRSSLEEFNEGTFNEPGEGALSEPSEETYKEPSEGTFRKPSERTREKLS